MIRSAGKFWCGGCKRKRWSILRHRSIADRRGDYVCEECGNVLVLSAMVAHAWHKDWEKEAWAKKPKP